MWQILQSKKITLFDKKKFASYGLRYIRALSNANAVTLNNYVTC